MILVKEHNYEEARDFLRDINDNGAKLKSRYDIMILNKMLSSEFILASRPHPTGGTEIIYAFSRTSNMKDVSFTITSQGYDFLYQDE